MEADLHGRLRLGVKCAADRRGTIACVVTALSSVFLLLASASTPVVNYDIVYVRAPRYGDTRQSRWPEIFRPAALDPGADLMLLHPDGSEEVLVGGGLGSVSDPF